MLFDSGVAAAVVNRLQTLSALIRKRYFKIANMSPIVQP